MQVSTIHDLAATVRGRRVALGLSQAELSVRMGASRDWVNSFEAGKQRAELILVLRLLEALGLRLDISVADHATPTRSAPNDLDALLDEYGRS